MPEPSTTTTHTATRSTEVPVTRPNGIKTLARFQEESFDDCYLDAKPLLERHWLEIAQYLDIPLSVDVDRYQQAEAAGILRIYTARLVTGEMIGYGVFTVTTNSHYSESRQALQDVLYVHPDYRRGTFGTRFVKYTEGRLRTQGVEVIYQHVKVKHPTLGKILERMGYEHVENIYGRRLR